MPNNPTFLVIWAKLGHGRACSDKNLLKMSGFQTQFFNRSWTKIGPDFNMSNIPLTAANDIYIKLARPTKLSGS